MIESLPTLSNRQLQWTNGLPEYYNGIGLPGGNTFHANTEKSTLVIQQILQHDYSITLNSFKWDKPETMEHTLQAPGLYATICLKGKTQHTLSGTNWNLKKKQYQLFFTQQPLHKIEYEKGEYFAFDFFFSRNLLNEIGHLFPQLGQVAQQSFKLLSIPTHCPISSLEILNSILQSHYSHQHLFYFLDNRIRDLLQSLLLHTYHTKIPIITSTDEQLKTLHEIEELLISDIATHYTVEQLAKKAGMNRYTFSQLFKEVFGASPHDYTNKKRFEKAKAMLANNFSVKETATALGFRPSHFSTAFTQIFGYAPTIFKKTNKTKH